MLFRRKPWREHSEGEKRFFKLALGGMLAVFVIGAPFAYIAERNRRQETYDRVTASCMADKHGSEILGNETRAEFCDRMGNRVANPSRTRQKTDREQIQDAADRLQQYCATTNDC